MGYCQTADIQAEFKSIQFSTTSLVTAQSVAQFITEAGGLIDATIGSRYVTPITGDTTSLALLSLLCRVLVSDRIRGILQVKQATNSDANSNVKGDSFRTSDVLAMLNEIKNGVVVLSGATLQLQNAGFYSNNQASGETARFQKDRKQW